MEHIVFVVGLACAAVALASRAVVAFREYRVRKLVTTTTLCGGCNQKIQLNRRHVTINRHIEFMDSKDSLTVLDDETVASYHLECAPS